MSNQILTQPKTKVIQEKQLTTLYCEACGKERPFRLHDITGSGFIHQCVICGGYLVTWVEPGSLRRKTARKRRRSLSPFEKLHWIIMRDFTRFLVVNTEDERFFKIRYMVDGIDDYEVHYMDYKPVEIHHQFKVMTQGHKHYPWVNGSGHERGGHGGDHE